MLGENPAIVYDYCACMFIWLAGNPVAWLISDREDEATIKCFLQAVKSQSPTVLINVAMTDDGTKNIQHN